MGEIEKDNTNKTFEPPDMFKDCSYYCGNCERLEAEIKKLKAINGIAMNGLDNIKAFTTDNNAKHRARETLKQVKEMK